MTVERLLTKITARRKLGRIVRHTFFWMLLIAYECSIIWFNGVNFGSFLKTIPFYVLNISLFYASAFYILPSAFSSRWPYGSAVLMLLAAMAAYLFLKWGIDTAEGNHPAALLSARIYLYIIPNLWRGVFFLSLSIGYWFFLRIILFRKEIADAEKRELLLSNERLVMEKEINDSRNAFLQQQLNPHAMFNALNFVYNTVNKYSADAGKCILLLAEIQRFALRETNDTGKVPLKEELEQIKNLIAIHQLRYNNKLQVTLKEDAGEGLWPIIPLVLFSFAENVFKHGDLKDPANPAVISWVILADGSLVFRTWNKKRRTGSGMLRKSVGMENAVKRLDYSYPGRYELTISDTDDSYQLELKLTL